MGVSSPAKQHDAERALQDAALLQARTPDFVLPVIRVEDAVCTYIHPPLSLFCTSD